jgi:ubiquitin-like protein Pup
MAEQGRKGRARRPAAEAEAAGRPPATARGEQIRQDLDRLLDEIDDVLEENAEEFLQSYIQRGGQ